MYHVGSCMYRKTKSTVYEFFGISIMATCYLGLGYDREVADALSHCFPQHLSAPYTAALYLRCCVNNILYVLSLLVCI